MADDDLDADAWRGFVERLCAAVGVDASLVDVGEIHELTRAVADGFTRPMAPVSAHVWGIARGQAPDAGPDALRAAILAAMPGASE